ncbi:pimeloyl-ACP methyl ester carboxylesterase [Luteibacter sp. Sphag1AF]|uniref:alpha/beta hydrolase n=1 Tax=Luteibacter sp. Sphag1AF TaxID=2587031 RepID=UPI00161C06AC|nr:alpha/beta hydrolase [Luteibacter sp. Sphag1AF]MBB3229033.1 pimeloyl-ACP methyl ester carboxylesterase [Luteibacter sp. Sphag1AF]
MRGHIILSHGSDSGPDATKVSVLAAVAESLGWTTARPDYREDDHLGYAGCIAPRLERLGAAIAASPTPPVLVGSSMGAFVSGLASLDAPVAGVFLLALPASIPGYARPFSARQGVPSFLIHGYADDVCPADAAIAYARGAGMPALLLDDDHRLSATLPLIETQFRVFLAALSGDTA